MRCQVARDQHAPGGTPSKLAVVSTACKQLPAILIARNLPLNNQSRSSVPQSSAREDIPSLPCCLQVAMWQRVAQQQQQQQQTPAAISQADPSLSSQLASLEVGFCIEGTSSEISCRIKWTINYDHFLTTFECMLCKYSAAALMRQREALQSQVPCRSCTAQQAFILKSQAAFW